MPVDLQALKIELATDPLGRGYAGRDDEAVAALLNAPTRAANRDAIDGGLLASALVVSEYAALTPNAKDYVRLVCATATPIPLTASFKTELGAVFGAGTATRANLLALLKRPGSRAEELNLGGSPTASHVADAKRLP